MNEREFLYPDETKISLLYKFIYKYEILKVKNLTDKQIKDKISNNMLSNFEATLSAIKKKGQCYNVRNNKDIYSLFHEYQKGKAPEAGFHFEKRNKNATFLISLLYHLRNTLAHANYKEEGNYYKIMDYDNTRLSAFGYIEKSVFVQLLEAFAE